MVIKQTRTYGNVEDALRALGIDPSKATNEERVAVRELVREDLLRADRAYIAPDPFRVFRSLCRG